MPKISQKERGRLEKKVERRLIGCQRKEAERNLFRHAYCGYLPNLHKICGCDIKKCVSEASCAVVQ